MGLYEAVFPHRGRLCHLYCTWRQFHSFAATYADRMEMTGKRGANISSEGKEGLLEAAKKGLGGIIIMSHVGSYEVAARAFQDYGLRLLLMVGEKEAKQVARDQREALRERGVQIQVSSPKEGSPFGGLEAIRFIREGGFVSLAGDLVWTDPRSLLQARLFGRKVNLPAAPHLLALVTGAPLFFMFALRLARRKHRIIMSPYRILKAPSRSERNKVLQESAQDLANALEETVRQHPFQWYVFEPVFQGSWDDEV